MGFGGIAFVACKAVLGIEGVVLEHGGIARLFGEDGSGSNGGTFVVTFDNRF